MKKLNLFLIALMCASLCFIGCKNPAGSSGETPLDLSKPLGDWVVGTWDIAETNTSTLTIGNNNSVTETNNFTGTVKFEGKEPTDTCVYTYEGEVDNSIKTVQDYIDSVSKETLETYVNSLNMTLKQYTLTINSSNDVITCVVKIEGTETDDDVGTVSVSSTNVTKLTKQK